MRRTCFLNPVASSDVLKLDEVFRGVVCESKHSCCCSLWYRTGLKVWSTFCCSDWVTVIETNREQSRFLKNQHLHVAGMFVFWFCSLISGFYAYEGGGMEQNTGLLWKGRKCSSRMFPVHFLLPSCLFPGPGLCWLFLPHAILSFQMFACRGTQSSALSSRNAGMSILS